MFKKVIKRIMIITLAVILALLLVRVIFIKSVRYSNPSAFNITDYEKYYLFQSKVPVYEGLFGPKFAYKIWFINGQKEKMSEKIKEDIIIELDELIMANSHILKNYEVKDDFKRINIFYYKDAYSDELNTESVRQVLGMKYGFLNETRYSRACLYLELIYGFGNIDFFEGINFIEV